MIKTSWFKSHFCQFLWTNTTIYHVSLFWLTFRNTVVPYLCQRLLCTTFYGVDAVFMRNIHRECLLFTRRVRLHNTWTWDECVVVSRTVYWTENLLDKTRRLKWWNCSGGQTPVWWLRPSAMTWSQMQKRAHFQSGAFRLAEHNIQRRTLYFFLGPCNAHGGKAAWSLSPSPLSFFLSLALSKRKEKSWIRFTGQLWREPESERASLT